ncbi:MAG: NYN domain-containing protein [Chromatiales bacterium]|jgi:uncharacterized protein (TIGR00288 family)|nr:NYN domain-containing protein [Chromatiales bacterium]
MSNFSELDNTLALFCDFENVALGVRDAKYPKFDMQLVLERLLLKGNIVVKKAYCDWERYKEFKAGMHDSAFELIEIPHTRQSGKNSADIRMVVDALDLCYTKDHIDTFVIISGDSDFSPLVSKLRENAKLVIGVGVKNSTSDLLTNNCDEFLYYDDLVRASDSTKSRRRRPAKKKSSDEPKKGEPQAAKKAGETKAPEAAKKTDKKQTTAKDAGVPKESAAATAEEPNLDLDKQDEAMDLVMETAEGLFAERGGRVWGSMIKQTIKRRRPGFNESYYGFRSFGELLEEAKERGLLDLEMDDRSGGFVVLGLHRED